MKKKKIFIFSFLPDPPQLLLLSGAGADLRRTKKAAAACAGCRSRLIKFWPTLGEAAPIVSLRACVGPRPLPLATGAPSHARFFTASQRLSAPLQTMSLALNVRTHDERTAITKQRKPVLAAFLSGVIHQVLNFYDSFSFDPVLHFGYQNISLRRRRRQCSSHVKTSMADNLVN